MMKNQSQARRILVVDDNRDAADMLADLLTMFGHVAVPVYEGAEALLQAKLFVPNVIFLDIGMPGVDGFDVVRELKKSDLFTSVKVIALTAWGDNETRYKARLAGFDMHLVKPASIEEILNSITDTANASLLYPPTS